jgi:hypothetical protein
MTENRTTKTGRWTLILILACLTANAAAQAFYDATGYKIAAKTGDSTCNVTGSDYVVQNGQLIRLFDGQQREDMGVYYFLRESDRITYYNVYDQRAGYYLTDLKRFVRVEPGSDKENQAAVMLDEQIYTADGKLTYRFDKGFPVEFIGFILFFFLG